MARPDAGPSRSHTQPNARPGEDEESFSPWLLLWTIVSVKIVTLTVIVVVGHANGRALIAVTSIPWLFAGVALAIGPLLFRARLRKVRARREELRRQEWMVLADRGSADDSAFHVKRD